MECGELRTRIRLFLRGELDRRDLEEFIDHVIACEPCERHLLELADEPEGRALPEGVTPRRGR